MSQFRSGQSRWEGLRPLFFLHGTGRRQWWLPLWGVLLVLLVGCGSGGTAAPAGTATAPKSANTAVIGADIQAFIAKYGQPTAASNVAGGSYNFRTYAGTQIDYIADAVVDTQVAAPFNTRVISLVVNPTPGQDWDAATAMSTCEAFGPPDASYVKSSQEIAMSANGNATGVQRVYSSKALGSEVDPSDFVDGQTNFSTLAPGVFDILLEYDSSPNQISYCSISVGIQSN